jgi:hypothetical protein
LEALHLIDLETRLEELACLKDGWLNGEGAALDRERLKLVADNFRRKFDGSLPLPYLYPTVDGGVLAEWILGHWAVSLNVDLASQTAQYHAVHLTADECFELSLDLNERAGWNSLGVQLRQLRGEGRPE